MRITLLEKNAERIQALEQSIARKDSETQALRAQLTAANQELSRLTGQLEDQQRRAIDDQRKSREAEERYRQAQAELEQLRARPDQTAALTKYEETVKRLEQERTQAKLEAENRGKETAQLQERIKTLETDAEKQVKALQIAAVTDLGFDGPSLDIIDPPLSKSRGVRVSGNDDFAISLSTGVRRSVTGRVLAPAGLRTLTINGEPVKPNDDGVFTAVLPALRSNNEEIAVQILAVDIQNKRAALKFC